METTISCGAIKDTSQEDIEYLNTLRAWVQDQAQRLGQDIEQLNKQLSEMHNMILPPTKRTTRKKASTTKKKVLTKKKA